MEAVPYYRCGVGDKPALRTTGYPSTGSGQACLQSIANKLCAEVSADAQHLPAGAFGNGAGGFGSVWFGDYLCFKKISEGTKLCFAYSPSDNFGPGDV